MRYILPPKLSAIFVVTSVEVHAAEVIVEGGGGLRHPFALTNIPGFLFATFLFPFADCDLMNEDFCVETRELECFFDADRVAGKACMVGAGRGLSYHPVVASFASARAVPTASNA
jgi:hypothetical protein